MFRLTGCLAVLGLFVVTAQAVTIETVPVGKLGNAPDTRYGATGYGSVSDAYNIGKYEVTAGQYRDFLNAVDPTGSNTLRLYSPSMNSMYNGCQITWNSGSSNYDFSGRPSGTEADWENRPVNYVTFWDAARFANWLHNGQGGGDTESGAYTLTADGIANNTVVRNADAQVFIPTEDEWYKAAYHDKSAGLAGTYFNYPTGSDSVPDGIDSSTDTEFDAVFWDGYNQDHPNDMDNAGDLSPYGTMGQGGNVWEWNETVIAGSSRGARGGDWFYDSDHLHASFRNNSYPTYEGIDLGFRVASIPEPSTLALLGMGAVGMLVYAWRKRKRA